MVTPDKETTTTKRMFVLRTDLYQQLEYEAERRTCSVSALVRLAIINLLEKRPDQQREAA